MVMFASMQYRKNKQKSSHIFLTVVPSSNKILIGFVRLDTYVLKDNLITKYVFIQIAIRYSFL
ncbi:hypothetical protein GM31_05880 [Trabulsiella odontotermitis]|uniref:Uncharacterized protein n=1 Tax=Trabulsiella odontotermitis TaxID=379893 RepID=A0A0L0GLW5_9ENTR|nr:hypothetical protein GM31_05880 [Trabulsiella odontotermitis]